MANKYLDLKNNIEQSARPNAYMRFKEDPTDVVGSAPRPIEETSYAKRVRFAAEAKEAEAASVKANSFGTLFKETVKGLPAGAMSIGRTVINDPIGSANAAAMGIANGLTLGAVDYMERKAFKDAFREGYAGEEIDDEQLDQMARSMLAPDDENLSAIRGGMDFASILVPYAGAEKLMAKGLAYAAPQFIKQYGTAAKVLTNIGAWNAVGQIEETSKPANERDRSTRALIDTALGITFPVAGAVFRKIRPNGFFGGKVSPAGTPTLVQEGEIVSKEALVRGAQERIATLEAKGAAMSVDEAKIVQRLKSNLENPDELFKIQNEGLPRPAGLGDAKAVVQTVAKEGDEPLFVATNDVDSLQNFIKGSNEIAYKKIDDLGTDLAGNKIAARHEFNPKTGQHIIYATDDVTASTLAHELGHYFDKELTKTVDGLSRLLPNFAKNREVIEDNLASLAVKRLGGAATPAQISAEIKNIAKAITNESSALSAIRRGGVANEKVSEQFADAVSQILTRAEARAEAPTVTALLKEAQARKTQKALGEGVVKELERSKEFGPKATAETIAKAQEKAAPKLKVEPQKFDVVTDPNLGKVAVPRIGSRVSVSGKEMTVKRISQTSGGEMRLTVHDPVSKARRTIALDKVDNIGTLQAMGKSAKDRTRVITVKPTREGKIKEVPKQLDRTPTGKKPDSAPIRAEKIAADQETEVFLNTKVLPKITGKERIGKSNEDILTRSLSSKMTEEEWNNILKERVGNLSEDVVKAKRIISDRVQGLRDGLLKDVDNMSATEMKELTAEYEKLVQTVEVFAGVRTEISNTFRSLGLEVAPGENDVLRNVVAQMQKVLGKEQTEFGFLQKAIKLRESSVVDKYYTVWYPAILSGPKTTARNIIGTGSNLISETLSQLFSKEGRATFLDRVNAMVGSGKSSFEQAKAVFRGDETILSKFNEGPSMRKADFKGPFAFLNNVEYVGRFLNAQDAFFSNIAKEGEVAALRAGKYSYGLTDEATINSLNEAVAKAFGQRSTYRNQFDRTVFGELGRLTTALKNSEIESVKAVSNFIVPFVRTVANVTDRKIDYIPFLNMFRVYKGKATPFIERRASRIVKDAGLVGAEADRVKSIVAERLWHQQMGKMYMGLTVAGTMIPMAMAGRITGAGPKDKNERDTLMLKGWRPNSLILPGGVVLPYQNLGPLAGVLSMAGNIADGIKYNDDDDVSVMEAMFNGLTNFMRGELDQSYLAGFSDVYDMISPYSYRPVGDILQEFALNAIPVPAAWTQTKDIIFPQRFEARDFDEKILNRIGLTSSLEPKLDAFGKPMYADLIWGLTPTMLNSDDPVLNWMDENNIFIGKPNRKQTIKDRRTGEKREMTPEEYTQFLSESGQAIYDKMEQAIKNGSINRYKDEETRKKVVEQIVSDIRAREKSGIAF